MGLRATRNGYGYLLALANGQQWVIVPSPETVAWVDELARIMQLKRVRSRNGAALIAVGHAARGNPPPRWGPLHHTDISCALGSDPTGALKYVKMLQFFYVIYPGILEQGGFACHGALVEHRGKGYILSGPSGIGKSTCCHRLPRPWTALCDDEVLVVPDGRNGFRAHPLPTWSVYLERRAPRTWDVTRHVRLAGIFFLERGRTDAVAMRGAARAAVSLKYLDHRLSFVPSLPPKLLRMRRALAHNICAFSARVPAFTLQVSPAGRFWEKMAQALDLPRTEGAPWN